MFANKRVFITGGSSGIGKQIAVDLLKRGAQVTISANDADKLEQTRCELAATGAPIFAFPCDVSELEQIRKVVNLYLERFGPPDILISNAGYAVYRTFEQMRSEEIARLLAVNFVGGCLVTREFLPSMRNAGGGNILFMASIAGRLMMTPCGVYSAAKHGLVTWARTLNVELARTNIHVHVICPGRVETNFFDDESFRTRTARRETELTISVNSVSDATLRAMERNQFLTYVPRSFGLLVWLVNTFPFPVEALLNRLMRSRIESLRSSKDHHDSL